MSIDPGDLGPVAKPMADGRVATLCQGCGQPIAVRRHNFDYTMAARVEGHAAVFVCKECSKAAQAAAKTVSYLSVPQRRPHE